jgi:predicted RNase H-like HicB family nuclease
MIKIAKRIARGYKLNVYFSKSDSCYLAETPALKGCVAKGVTESEAYVMGRRAAWEWVFEALNSNDTKVLPEPDVDE